MEKKLAIESRNPNIGIQHYIDYGIRVQQIKICEHPSSPHRLLQTIIERILKHEIMKTSKQPKHQNIATCAETLFVCILFSLFFYLSNGAKQSQLFIHHRDDNTVIVIQLQSNASILVHPLDSQHS